MFVSRLAKVIREIRSAQKDIEKRTTGQAFAARHEEQLKRQTPITG
jgi:hypothetical protein